MNTQALTDLMTFRANRYAAFACRQDVLFELTDALLTAGPVGSLPSLSLQAPHRCGWGSLYDALAAGRISTERLRRLVAGHPFTQQDPCMRSIRVSRPAVRREARPQREMRGLTRYRTSLVRERAAEVNRLQKVLEGANSKLAAVAKDILGASGHDILTALVQGHTQASELAQLACGRLREKLPQLEQALAGQFQAHQRFLVAQQLVHIDFLDGLMERVSTEIAERMHPFEAAVVLDTIPCIGRRIAEIFVAEVGVKMSHFPTAAHLAAWAGPAPGNNESAGKRRPACTRKGSLWLRAALVEAAQPAARSKTTYLGANYFDERARHTVERRLVHRLEALGYTVSLQPPGSVA